MDVLGSCPSVIAVRRTDYIEEEDETVRCENREEEEETDSREGEGKTAKKDLKEEREEAEKQLILGALTTKDTTTRLCRYYDYYYYCNSAQPPLNCNNNNNMDNTDTNIVLTLKRFSSLSQSCLDLERRVKSLWSVIRHELHNPVRLKNPQL